MYVRLGDFLTVVFYFDLAFWDWGFCIKHLGLVENTTFIRAVTISKMDVLGEYFLQPNILHEQFPFDRLSQTTKH